MAQAFPPRLAHRGVALLEPGLLPLLARAGWREEGALRGVRLVRTAGALLAPTEAPPAAVEALAAEGAGTLVLLGTCASPTRALEPGDVLIVERARLPAGFAWASAALAARLAEAGTTRGLRCRRGTVASRGLPASHGELAQDLDSAAFLAAAADAELAAGAMLVCTGPEPGAFESPPAIHAAFERLLDVVQDTLGPEGPPAE